MEIATSILFVPAAVLAGIAMVSSLIDRFKCARTQQITDRTILESPSNNSTRSAGTLNLVELSNYASGKINEAAWRREAKYAEATELFDLLTQSRLADIDYERAALSGAWYKRDFLAGIKAWWRLRKAKASRAPSPPVMADAGRDEILWRTGQEGESALQDFLLRRLDGEWTLLAGYKNRKGEIDRILVGPGGVFVFEVKNTSGTVYCDGDLWLRDKRDRYGNVIETDIPIADRGGRGPSRQLNEPAHNLQEFLARRGVSVKAHRVIVFTHDRALLGNLKNVKVDAVMTLPFSLREMLALSDTKLDGDLRDKIVSLIRQDHTYHAKPRRPVANYRPQDSANLESVS